jgi:hypothetical protein
MMFRKRDLGSEKRERRGGGGGTRGGRRGIMIIYCYERFNFNFLNGNQIVMNGYVMIVVILVVIGCFLLFGEKKQYNMAPKRIWTYWDREDRIPKSVRMCMRGWAKWNPDYDIVLLTKKNYKGYVTIPEELTSHPNFNDMPARFADLVRVWTLAEHGGVWMDSTILLKSSLNTWLFPKYAEFSGFYLGEMTKEHPPIIENWFFACNKGSRFVQLWKEEFSQVARYPTVDDYVESRIQMGVDIKRINTPFYLSMHVAAQKVLQIDRYPLESMILRKAEEGPLRYLVDAKWNSEKAIRLACSDPSYQTPILKMRGNERTILDQELEGEFSEKKCGWTS